MQTTATRPEVKSVTLLWTIEDGLLQPEPFLNRHPVLFYCWAVQARIRYLRKLRVETGV